MEKSRPAARGVPKSFRDELNGALDAFLNKMQVVHGSTDWSHAEELYALARRLGQQEPWKSHIRFGELFDILSVHAQRYGLAECGGELTPVAAHLGNERFEQFRNDVHAYLRSLPRNFEITFDLPSMPSWGSGELKIADNISLVERYPNPAVDGSKVRTAIVAALLGETEARHVPVVLKIDASGFGSADVNSTAVANAISQMKQFFQMFRRISPYKDTPGIINSRMAPEVKCRVIDPAYPNEIMYVQLPAHLRSFLSKVSLDEDKLEIFDYSTGATVLGATERKAVTRDEKSSALILHMTWITTVLNCPDDWPDAGRLRSALEWGFDSAENDNQTFAFIQACIGIEALLGDDDKDEPLTTRLADRCAYLLGTSHKDRVDIRKRFKKMYDVRSKVVHGRGPRLSYPDAQELNYAQIILGDVVTAEAKALLKALDKAKNRANNPN